MERKENKTSQNGYRAPAVHRSFQLLRTVAEAKRGLRIVELAQRLGYSASTTHGLVHALLRENALVQSEDSHELFLGPLVAELAFTDWNYLRVNELARPVLNEIRDSVDATVILGVRIRSRVMITATAEAVESLKISAPVGTTLPIFAGATGKAFLAHETTDRVRRLIGARGLPQYTPNSVVSVEDYLNELQEVRVRGYALDDEEYLSGVRAVAVPLNNLPGLPMAIWVVGFAANMSMERLHEVAGVVTAAAKKLRLQLQGSRE